MAIKLDPPKPTVTAPRPQPKPAAPPPPANPPVDKVAADAIARKTGRTSSFEAFRPPSVAIQNHEHHGDGPSQGRGTTDDSLGCHDPSKGRNRGTPDDSIGVDDPSAGRNRGTPDDSIGVNDPAAGRNRGTPDDSIGRNRGTPDDSIGGDGSVRGRGTNDDGVGGLPGRPGGLGEILQNAMARSAGRAGLPEDTLSKMDALLAKDPATAFQAEYVFSHQAFRDMSVEDREKIVDVMAAGGERATRAMAQIFNTSDGALLNQVGKDGTRLIDSLDKLAASPTGKRLLNDCMYDIVNPGRIWQGQAPTCTVSSMQYELASQQPAEYARLVAGLGVDGQVTMRGGGTLTTSASTAMLASSWNNDRRSTTEAVFQTAAMEYANGGDTYNMFAQENHRSDGQTYKGLYPDQIRTMVGELFGAKYETLEIGSDAEATAELNQIMSQERPNRPVLFDIDMGDFNHCVALDRIQGDRVYYRDPYSGEMESMSKDEFRRKLVAVHYAVEPEPLNKTSVIAAAKYGSKLFALV